MNKSEIAEKAAREINQRKGTKRYLAILEMTEIGPNEDYGALKSRLLRIRQTVQDALRKHGKY